MKTFAPAPARTSAPRRAEPAKRAAAPQAEADGRVPMYGAGHSLAALLPPPPAPPADPTRGETSRLEPPVAQRQEEARGGATPPADASRAGAVAPTAEPPRRWLERPSERSAARPPPNRTGLPDRLKANVEAMSGLSLDDVRVHRNSPKPAQLQALAYARGTEIHLGPGQERHLPHEAWHVVQQKQGRVRPTLRSDKSALINDDRRLELEADGMSVDAVKDAENPVRAAGSFLGGRNKSHNSGVDLSVQRKIIKYNEGKGYENQETVKKDIENIQIKFDEAVESSAKLLLKWSNYKAYSSAKGHIGKWYKSAYSYCEDPTQDDSFLAAAYGYAIETIACKEVGKSLNPNYKIDFQAKRGGTRPDIVVKEGKKDIAWIDITADTRMSRGHIFRKNGDGWNTTPWVTEIVYNALEPHNLYNQLNDFYDKTSADFAKEKNVMHKININIAKNELAESIQNMREVKEPQTKAVTGEEAEVDGKKKDESKNDIKSRADAINDLEVKQETKAVQRTRLKSLVKEYLKNMAIKNKVSVPEHGNIAAKGALDYLGISTSPFGLHKTGIRSDSYFARELVEAMAEAPTAEQMRIVYNRRFNEIDQKLRNYANSPPPHAKIDKFLKYRTPLEEKEQDEDGRKAVDREVLSIGFMTINILSYAQKLKGSLKKKYNMNKLILNEDLEEYESIKRAIQSHIKGELEPNRKSLETWRENALVLQDRIDEWNSKVKLDESNPDSQQPPGETLEKTKSKN